MSDGGRPVAVLGYQVATNLFVGESPVGKEVKIGDEQAEVIGVLEAQGTFLGEFSWDNRIVIPIRFLATAFDARSTTATRTVERGVCPKSRSSVSSRHRSTVRIAVS